MSKMNRRNFVKAAVTGTAAASVAAPSMALAADGKKTLRLRMQTYWGKEADSIFDTFTDNIKQLAKALYALNAIQVVL